MNQPIEIVGIGVSVLDIVMVLDGTPVEESVVQASDRRLGLGGGIAVAAATASMLGRRSCLLDRLGFDHASGLILETLRGAGVQDELLQRSDSASASVATIWVNKNSGDRTIVFSPGEDIELQWSASFEPFIAQAKVLHLSGRHLSASHEAVEIAKQHGTLVSYDGGAHRFREEILPLFCRADIAIVALQFAQQFCLHAGKIPLSEPDELAGFIRDQIGCRLAGVTDGARGSWFCAEDGDAFHQPAVPVGRVRDTTGCGDVFHGAFLTRLTAGDSYRDCARFASTVAADNARSLGALAFNSDGAGGASGR